MITGFVYKFGLVWLGWIVVKKEEPITFYYCDNTTSVTMHYENRIKYVAFGLTRNSVTNKLQNYVYKREKKR